MWPFKKKQPPEELRAIWGGAFAGGCCTWTGEPTNDGRTKLEERAKELETEMAGGLVRIQGKTFHGSTIHLVRDFYEPEAP